MSTLLTRNASPISALRVVRGAAAVLVAASFCAAHVAAPAAGAAPPQRLATAPVTALDLLLRDAPSTAAGDSCSFTPSSGDWNTAGNWSCGHVPTGADQVTIATTKTAQLGAPGFAGDVTLSGGTIQFTASTTLDVGATFTTSGGTITGTGTVTERGAFTLSSGTLTISAGATFVPDVDATLSAGSICLTGTGTVLRLTHLLTIATGGSFSTTCGTTTGTRIQIDAGGELRKSSTAAITLTIPIENAGMVRTTAGTLTWTGAPVGSAGGAYLADASATLVLDPSAALTVAAAGRLGGAGTITVSSPVTLQDGATLDPGTLRLSSLGETERLTVGGSDPLQLTTFRLESGIFTTAREVQVVSFVADGGALDGAFTLSVPAGGSFTKTTGTTVTISNGVSLVTDVNVTLSTGAICLVGATTSWRTKRTLTLATGISIAMLNCVAAGTPGRLLIDSTGELRSTNTFVNGTSINLAVDNAGVVRAAAATLALAGAPGAVSSGAYLAEASATLVLNPSGSMTLPAGARLGGAGTITVSSPVTLQDGATLDPGTLRLSSLGSTERLTVEGIDPLQLTTFRLESGIFTTAREVQVTSFVADGGTLDGAFTLSVPAGGSFTKTTGTTVTISNGVSLVTDVNVTLSTGAICLVGATTSWRTKRTLTLATGISIAMLNCVAAGTPGRLLIDSTGELRSTNTAVAGTTINLAVESEGTITVASSQQINLTGTLTQTAGLTTIAATGTFGGNGTRTVSGGEIVVNGTLGGTGAKNVTGGEIVVNGTLAGTLALTGGGALRGTGQTGTVVNTSGTVAAGASTGTLTIGGSYTQGAGGTLAEEIAGTTPGTQFDRLTVTGSVSLGGTLAIDSSSFTPALVDTFKIIGGASSRTGTFSALTGETLPGVRYRAQYDSDGATLVVDAVPQHTLSVSLTGSGTGSVASADGGISCGSVCSHSYNEGTVVTLDATPGTGSKPVEWGGACSGSGSCTVTLDVDRPVSARFDLANRAPTANDLSVETDEDAPVPVTLTGTDADGDPLTFAVTSGPSHGELSGLAPELTYAPVAGFFGTDSFTYVASDGMLGSNTATVSITVRSVNDAPVASDGSLALDEDTDAAVTLVATDPDGDALTYELVDGPGHGSMSGTGATRTYTPDRDYIGPDSFTFRASDGPLGSNTATVSITVRPINDAPVAVDGSLELNEDAQAGVTLVATDVDGHELTYELLAGPAHGSLTGPGATRTYAPDPNFFGADAFTFRATDGSLGSNTATVSITVRPVNDAPVAVDGGLSTDEDVAAGVTLPATDLDGDSLSYSVVAGPAHGTLSGSGATRTYTPDLDYFGPDSFTFKASDGTVDSNTATVSITVRPVNDAPVAAGGSLVTDRNVAKDVTLVASDIEGDVLGYAIVNAPAHGTLSGTGATRTYTPDAGYFGPDSFTFRASDASLDSNTATVSITVRAVNDAPVAVHGSLVTDEDIAAEVSLNATDANGDTLSYAIVAGPSHGTLSGSGATRTYTPAGDYFGPDSLTFKASDGSLDSNTATVSIIVRPVNDAPVAFADSLFTDEDEAEDSTLLATDPDGDTLNYSVMAGPAHGTLSGTGATRTYTPDRDYFGPDSFTFKASDGTVDSNTATVSITVRPVNDAPVAAGGSLVTDRNVAKDVTLVASDIEGDVLGYAIVNAPAHGTLSGTGATRTYTPDAGYFGPDSFTFRASDASLDSNTATVSITVRAVNDAPVAVDGSLVTDEDIAAEVTLNATDANGDTLSYAIVAGPSHGTLSGSGATRTYTPDRDYFGPDSLTFKASDGSLDSNTATVSITVRPVNDAPVAFAASLVIRAAQTEITLTATDVDGDSLAYPIVAAPSHGALSHKSGATWIYHRVLAYTGPDSFSFQANDGRLHSNTATVTLTLEPFNRAPVASDGSVMTDQDVAKDVGLSAADPDGDPLTYSIVVGPAHGSLSGSGATRAYIPHAGFWGADSFTFKASDGSLESNVATVSIIVRPVNHAPVASDGSLVTDQDVAMDVTFVATDLDGDALTYSIVAVPAHGSLSGSGATRTYTPHAGYSGPDSFTFKASDGSLDSNTATVTITITQVVDEPDPHDRIQDAKAALSVLLPTGDDRADKKIAAAIKHLGKSLDPELWLDDSHLTKKGWEVFDEARAAVDTLTQIKDPPVSIAGTIDALVQMARALAQTAIDEATAAGGDPRLLAVAANEMTEASDQLAKGRPGRAIDHFGRAWTWAQRSLR